MLVMTVRRAASWRGETEGEGEREGGGGAQCSFQIKALIGTLARCFLQINLLPLLILVVGTEMGRKMGKMKPVFLLYKNMLQNTCVTEDVPLELWIGNHTHMEAVSKETFS